MYPRSSDRQDLSASGAVLARGSTSGKKSFFVQSERTRGPRSPRRRSSRDSTSTSIGKRKMNQDDRRGRGGRHKKGETLKQKADEDLSSSRSDSESSESEKRPAKKPSGPIASSPRDRPPSGKESRRIMCRNLPTALEEQQVINFFQKECSCLVKWVELTKDEKNGRAKALLQFSDLSGVSRALRDIHDKKFFDNDIPLRIYVEEESVERDDDADMESSKEDMEGKLKGRGRTKSQESDRPAKKRKTKKMKGQKSPASHYGDDTNPNPRDGGKANGSYHRDGKSSGYTGGPQQLGQINNMNPRSRYDDPPTSFPYNNTKGDHQRGSSDTRRRERDESMQNPDPLPPRVIIRNLATDMTRDELHKMGAMIAPLCIQPEMWHEEDAMKYQRRGPKDALIGAIQYSTHVDTVEALVYFDNKYVDGAPHPMRVYLERNTAHDETVIHRAALPAPPMIEPVTQPGGNIRGPSPLGNQQPHGHVYSNDRSGTSPQQSGGRSRRTPNNADYDRGRDRSSRGETYGGYGGVRVDREPYKGGGGYR